MANQRLRIDIEARDKASKTIRNVGSSLNRANRASRKTRETFVQLGYALDDMQYGFRGVQNNLQQIAVQSSASGPVVLGLTALTIALNYVIEHWDEFGDRSAKALDKAQDKLKETQDGIANLMLAQAALEDFDSDGKLLEKEKAKAKATALHAAFQTVIADKLAEQLELQEDIARIEAGGSASTWQLLMATFEDIGNMLSGEGGGQDLNEIALGNLKEDLEENTKDIESTLGQFKKNIEDLLKGFPDLFGDIFGTGGGSSGRKKVKSAKLEFDIAGTSLEELKKWQKQATKLMKSFAHEWGIEWDKVGKITVMGGDKVADALRGVRDKLGHNVKKVEKVGYDASSNAAAAFANIGVAIGEALAGQGNIGEKFLNILGTFMVQFGSALIALGIAESAWLSSFDPGTKIAAGAALVVAGAAISAAYSKKPGGSGNRVSASSSRQHARGVDTSSDTGNSVTFKIKGQDLVGALDYNRNVRNSYIPS